MFSRGLKQMEVVIYLGWALLATWSRWGSSRFRAEDLSFPLARRFGDWYEWGKCTAACYGVRERGPQKTRPVASFFKGTPFRVALEGNQRQNIYVMGFPILRQTHLMSWMASQTSKRVVTIPDNPCR